MIPLRDFILCGRSVPDFAPGLALALALSPTLGVALALALPAPSTAQAPGSGASGEAGVVLAAAAERYRGLATFCADFRQVVENEILRQTTRSRGELCQARPDRFEMRFTDPEGDRVVADGEYVWVYLPSTDPGQAFRGDLGEVGGRFDLHEEFLSDPDERYAASHEGREDVGGRTTHVLALEPRGASPYLRARIWIDAEDHLIRRAEIVEDEGFTRTLELSALRLNPTLADERFEFEPPPGVHVIHR